MIKRIKKIEIKGEAYKLLHPKLAVLICSKYKKNNVMAAAWVTPVSEEPPLVAACIWKKGFTAEQISKGKEFTINIPTQNLLRQVLICGSDTGRKVDKARKAGLTYEDSKNVKAPIISECSGHIECKLLKRIDGGECWIFLGKIVSAYATKNLMARKERVLLHLGGKKFAIPKKI